MCRRVHTEHANSSLSGIARRPMGCAPQSRTPAPPEVSGPLDPGAKPNPRARLSPDEPLPGSTVSHCDSRKPPVRTGESRRPRAASRKPPARTGAGCGQPPTRSFGSPQGEKVAKPHIDLRHRLRIHDSGDVDEPSARYGPRLLGHGVRRTTQNELRPPPPRSKPPHGRLRTDDVAPMRRKADAPAGAAARRRFMAQNPHVYGFRLNVAK